MKNIFTAALAALLLVGCASWPSDPEEFNAAIQQSVPSKEGIIRLSGEGCWYPNISGASQLSLGAVVAPILGALIITENAVLFSQWDKDGERFYITKKIPIPGLHEAKLESYVRQRYIVLRSGEYQYDSFSFLQGGMIDQEKTEAGQKLLASAIKK